MDSQTNYIDTVKTNIMKKMLNFTDPEYYLLKFNQTLATDEAKFIEVYENIYLMQGISLLAMIPSAFYLFRVRRYRTSFEAKQPGFTLEGLKSISKRLIFFLSFGTVLAINSQVYAYMNDFSKLMKEIGNREKQAYDEGRLIQL